MKWFSLGHLGFSLVLLVVVGWPTEWIYGAIAAVFFYLGREERDLELELGKPFPAVLGVLHTLPVALWVKHVGDMTPALLILVLVLIFG